MSRLLPWLLAAAVWGCFDPVDDSGPFDQDGDGYLARIDCDDGNPAIHPAATEVCNGADDDCDGDVDGGATDAVTWYADVDGDGFGDAAAATVACAAPAGSVAQGGDCAPDVPAVNPGATEVCNGIDDDCVDGVDVGAVDLVTWYADVDGDGSGDDDTAVTACEPPGPAVTVGGDCNDVDASVDGLDVDGDGASTCDGDCDDADASRDPADLDGDGWSSCAGDCDDLDTSLHPGDADFDGSSPCAGDCDDADPWVDGLDGDGDGATSCAGDCDDAAAGLNLRDDDGDGFTTCGGDCNDASPGLNLADVDGDSYTSCEGDCNDFDAAYEIADIDLDGASTCDGDCDDRDPTVDPLDADADGRTSCDGDCDDDDPLVTDLDGDLDGASACAGDCDDADPALNVRDVDLDGLTTCGGDCSDLDGLTVPVDADGDGSAPCQGDCDDADPFVDGVDRDADGYSSCAGDCDDLDPSRSPGRSETCAAGDQDCDGVVDDNPVDAPTWFEDVDGDGFGDPFSSLRACTAPAFHSPTAGDCNDGNPAFAPGAPDSCGDGLDTDCDGADDCLAGQHDAGDAWVTWDGPTANDLAGSDLAAADLDGDGADDILVGARGHYLPAGQGWAGQAWLIYGGPGLGSGSLATVSQASFEGTEMYGEVGAYTAAVGDLDADGYQDLGFAAPVLANGGVTWLLYGDASRRSGAGTTADADAAIDGGATFGVGLGPAGDLNGDGFADVIGGDGYSQGRGRVNLILGDGTRLPAAGTNPDLWPYVEGADSGDGLGKIRGLSADGDFDGDGLNDVAMGGHDGNDGGVYLLYGAPSFPAVTSAATLPSVYSGANDAVFGMVVRFVGDVSGDGHDDLMISDPADYGVVSGGGRVELYLGDATRWTGVNQRTLADADLWSPQVNATLGNDLAPLGDVDGDGLDDVAIAAPWGSISPMLSSEGAVAVFTGASLAGSQSWLSAPLLVGGNVENATFGESLATGDVDGDGNVDLLVSATRHGNSNGRVYVFNDLW